jgi:acetyl esterase/lipase
MRKESVWRDCPGGTPRGMALTGRVIRNAPYSSKSDSQKLDLYLPDQGDRPAAVIVWLHPGGFFAGDKDGSGTIDPLSYVNLPCFFGPSLERGYAVASVNYRLSDEALFPALIYDVKASIRWIRANAAKYGLNLEKIGAWGFSAGGYLAAMLAVSGGVGGLEDPSLGNPGESSRICAAVDWYGPTDFLQMDPQHVELGQPELANDPASPESRLIGGALPLHPEKCRASSPITYVGPESVPIYIQHGKQDDIVPYLQSVALYERLEQTIGTEKAILEIVENAGHADPLSFRSENVNKMLDFLDGYLK